MNPIIKYEMISNMRKHGGSFVVALAECFARADAQNIVKLQNAFPEYVEKYKNWNKSLDRQFNDPIGQLDRITEETFKREYECEFPESEDESSI